MSEFSGVFIDDAHPAPAQRYAERRQRLLSELDGIAVLQGIQVAANHHHPWLYIPTPIRQNPTFLYYTGINQEGATLILDPFDSERSELLFLPQKNLKKEFWEGVQLGIGPDNDVSTACACTGIQHIFDHRLLRPKLLEKLERSRRHSHQVYTFFNENPHKTRQRLKDDQYAFKARLSRWVKSVSSAFEVCNLAPSIWEHRPILDEQDRRNLNHATTITADAFCATLQALPGLKTETEVAGYLNGAIWQRTPHGNSFPSIVASGKNATVLHYGKNDDVLQNDRLLLLDFGARYHQMNADMSRTIPINGKYNALQRLLYDIVLDAQQAVENAARSGVSINALNTICWTFIESELDRRFFKKGGKAQRPYDKQPHNVSHLIGHEVHDGDPFRLYRDKPLVPGMAISNEPGLYGYFEIKMDGRLFQEHVGIRIEDTLFLTKTGCENLSIKAPKRIVDIEGI